MFLLLPYDSYSVALLWFLFLSFVSLAVYYIYSVMWCISNKIEDAYLGFIIKIAYDLIPDGYKHQKSGAVVARIEG